MRITLLSRHRKQVETHSSLNAHRAVPRPFATLSTLEMIFIPIIVTMLCIPCFSGENIEGGITLTPFVSIWYKSVPAPRHRGETLSVLALSAAGEPTHVTLSQGGLSDAEERDLKITAFDSYGTRVAVVRELMYVNIYDENMHNLKELKDAQLDIVRDIQWSLDGKLIAVGGGKQTSTKAVVWEVDSGRMLCRLSGDEAQQVWSLLFLTDANGNGMLAGGDAYGRTHIWQIEGGRDVTCHVPDTTGGKSKGLFRVTSLAYCERLGFLAVGRVIDTVTLLRFDGRNLEMLSSFEEGGGAVTLAWLRDGSYLVTGSISKGVQAWRIEGKNVVKTTCKVSLDSIPRSMAFDQSENNLIVYTDSSVEILRVGGLGVTPVKMDNTPNRRD